MFLIDLIKFKKIGFRYTMTPRLYTSLIIITLVLLPIPSPASDTVFTYRAPESTKDSRYEYDTAVLKLALEKTKAKWGGYHLKASPVMNHSRAIEFLRSEKLENPMFKVSANNSICEEIPHVPFPIDLGIVGYRLFFVSDQTNHRLKKIKSLRELKKMTIGQGSGWLDTKILNQAGFKVVTIPKYESLFHMVAENRFDLLSRGINEIESEYASYRHIKDFSLNKTVGLYYPLPRFFFTNKGSQKALHRVYEGLVMAFNDGSLLKLWEHHYNSSLQFAHKDEVTFFKINNPFISKIEPSYKQFLMENH